MVYSEEELLKLAPELIQSWLDDIFAGRVSTKPNYNWHGLAEAAGSRASNVLGTIKDEESLKWAYIAISIYNYLAKTGEPTFRSSFERSAMMIHAYMINKFGNVPRHPILDTDIVQTWFFKQLPMSLQSAKALLPKWKSNMNTAQQLRQIKNSLSVVQSLSDNGYLHENQKLIEWLKIKDELP